MKKLKRSIETMPRAAYIFLKSVLAIAAVMLTVSFLLFRFAESLSARHLATLLLETPAGVLLCGCIGLAFMLDRC